MATPPTVPLELPIVATGVLLLLQVPPPLVLLKLTVELRHTPAAPVIGLGIAFTVSVRVV